MDLSISLQSGDRKITVLVADDEEYLKDLYVELLTTEGYNVLSATNGKDALDLTREHLPKVVILDVMMPIMSGNEVLAALKESEETRHIPVIILTNAANMENMANAKLYNAFKYLIKSNIDPSVLIQEVKIALTPKNIFEEATPEDNTSR